MKVIKEWSNNHVQSGRPMWLSYNYTLTMVETCHECPFYHSLEIHPCVLNYLILLERKGKCTDGLSEETESRR